MKLWVKLTCIAVFVTLTAISGTMFTFSSWQSKQIITESQESAENLMNLFCTNLESSVENNSIYYMIKRTLVRYYFESYAQLFSENAYFSLTHNGDYLYNQCPYDPVSLLTVKYVGEDVSDTFQFDGRYFYIMARPIDIGGNQYVVYLCTDVTSAYDRTVALKKYSALLVILSAVLVLIVTSLLVRRALRPMDELRKAAEEIAGGHYDLRARVQSNDEVAALAYSFNNMTDAVQTHIDELTEQSERRKLLLGALAHELKTPMTAVIGFAESLLKMPLDERQRMRCAEEILTAGQRTERISRKLTLLLSLSEGEAIEKQPFDLSAFADELRKMYGNDRVKIAADGSMVGERDLLFTLTQNLINNALNASDTDSIVNVTLSEKMICVADSGRGIPAEHIKRVTEPFYRVDKARSRKLGGTGLGLSLCKAIAEAHGGTLSIESAPGQGTTVRVDLM